MKTKRNIRSNPRVNNRGADVAVVLLALLVIFFASHRLMENLNKTFSRTDKTPVATVTFKYKAVQRKFLDRAVWDRPQQNSPVYNGDTIRTAPNAEATLYFVDRNVVELGSSTMIQVFVNNEESQINLDSGQVSVATSDSSNMVINAENTTAKVGKGSTLRADKSGAGNTQFVVEKGEAALSGQDGTDAARVLTQGTVVQTGTEQPVVMISPGKSIKLLNQSGKGVDVPFQWQTTVQTGDDLYLETAPFSNFSDETQRYTVTGLTEFTIPQQKNSFYWRLYAGGAAGDEQSMLGGKITIVSAPAPVLLEPVFEAKYTYVETPPSIRFLWEGNTLAASYLLEVADNPDFRNPQFSRFTNTQSLTLPEFTEGTWYWRVTPRYLIGTESAPESSKIAFFHVEQQNAVQEAPQALFPQAMAETARGQEMTFAWKNKSETKSYRVKVAKDAQMKNIVVDTVVESNSFKLADAAAVLPNGDYYWTVSGIDSKGMETAATAPVRFETMNSDFSLRSIFPPEGYTIADSLCPDIRFTWKTNVEADKRFQVSASPDFEKLTADMTTNGNGIEGVSLPQGTWYWRVITESNVGTVKSEIKQVVVAEPLEKPRLLGVTQMVMVLAEKKNKFAWTPVAGADYYQLRIFKPGHEDDPVYENLFVTNTEIEIPLQHVEDGLYRLTIQGFSAASITSTRRYGLAVDHDFMLRQLRPVELLYPRDSASVEGLDAALRPFSFKWSAMVEPSSAQFILRKKGTAAPILDVQNPSKEVQAPWLDAGKYTWEVKATVFEGFDISSSKPYTFTVLPIPPLPPASFIVPEQNAVLNAAFFKSYRSIDFQWTKVPDATHYRFTLRNAQGKPLVTRDILADAAETPEFNFQEITLLSRGSFTAEVRAQRWLSNGKVFQDGTVSRLSFEIDLPKPTSVRVDETGVLYGR